MFVRKRKLVLINSILTLNQLCCGGDVIFSYILGKWLSLLLIYHLLLIAGYSFWFAKKIKDSKIGPDSLLPKIVGDLRTIFHGFRRSYATRNNTVFCGFVKKVVRESDFFFFFLEYKSCIVSFFVHNILQNSM